jgi:hypothetical protein
MNGLKNNPYVGTFHGRNYVCDGTPLKQCMLEDSKRNPLIGVFRHSPAQRSKSLGLKSILYGEPTEKQNVFSQLQVARETKKVPTHNFLRSLRQIPTKVYSSSSVGSRSSVSASVISPHEALQPVDAPKTTPVAVDENVPMCSICIEPYADGDELRTFACSHCFHNECVSKWIFHRCLNDAELESFNCPECRQNHITLSEAGSSQTSLADGMCNLSYLQVGETLGGGYDFLSDFGSELQSPLGTASCPASPRPQFSRPGSALSSGTVGTVGTTGTSSHRLSVLSPSSRGQGPGPLPLYPSRPSSAAPSERPPASPLSSSSCGERSPDSTSGPRGPCGIGSGNDDADYSQSMFLNASTLANAGVGIGALPTSAAAATAAVVPKKAPFGLFGAGSSIKHRVPLFLGRPVSVPVSVHVATGSSCDRGVAGSSRLMGIFPVPEDSYCVADSVWTANSSSSPSTNAFSPAPTSSASGSGSCSAKDGAAVQREPPSSSSLLSEAPMNVSVISCTTPSAAAPAAAASAAASACATPLTHQHTPRHWAAAADPLCASAYSDCGTPLPKDV